MICIQSKKICLVHEDLSSQFCDQCELYVLSYLILLQRLKSQLNQTTLNKVIIKILNHYENQNIVVLFC